MACIPDAPIDHANDPDRALADAIAQVKFEIRHELAESDRRLRVMGPRMTALVSYFTENLQGLLERAPLSKHSLRRDEIRDVFIDEALSDQGPDIPVPLEGSDDQSILHIIAENEWIAELGTIADVCGPEDDIMTAAHALCALAFRNALRDVYPVIVNSLDHV